ncbi:transposase [Emticicia fontis]
MKTNGLLKYQRIGKVRGKRNWVKDLVPTPVTEFSFLEFDIKYIYVSGKRTNVQVLTVLDVYSRWNMGQYINWSIRANDVIALFDEIFQNYQMPRQFIVRNDNGSQFEADMVQQYMRLKGVTQEFTLPATPQQNAHIESYHSILESAVCQRMELENLENTREVMKRFREFYNFNRIHGGLGFKSPYKYLLVKN